MLTTALAQKALDLAVEANQKHPASPADAANRFLADFNGEFGDIVPVSLHVVDTQALTVFIWTPLVLMQQKLRTALATLEPLPTLDALLALNSGVVVSVQPKQRGAPDIRRVVVFRGDRQLAPEKSTLAPQVFTNAFGAQFSLTAGTIEFSREALTPGAEDLRVVCLTGTTPIEWKLSAAEVAKVR
jgi:hypothetical protein